MDITNYKLLLNSMKANLIKASVYCLMVLLSACSSSPEKTTSPTTEVSNYPQQLLDQAALTSQPLATKLRLKASEAFIQEENYPASLSAIALIQPEHLTSNNLKAHYLLVKSVSLVHTKDPAARSWLDQMSSDHLAILNTNQQWLWQQSNALELHHSENTSQAIALLEHQRPMLSDDESTKLSNTIWKMVSELNDTRLNKELNTSTDDATTGWLKLALIINNESATQYKGLALNQWLSNYAEHPAAQNLPIEAQNLPTPELTSIKNIALLLPLEGRFTDVSKAIANGLIMASYQQPADSRPSIKIYNSMSSDFISTYQSINADLIIGPLRRKNIKLLADLPSLTHPTLALNSIQSETKPANLFYMDLQAEDEAKTMAKFASEQSYEHGAILTYDSNKGFKVAKTFQDAFAKHEGNISHIQSLEKNWANSLQKILEIDNSNARAKNLSRTLRSPIEFTARRREDIDFIYSPLKYKDLRQTNPLMAFYFAEDIPVLSNSDISTKLYSQQRDKDLNGVIFSDFSWDPEKIAIKSLPGKYDPSAKLYSWGADAMHIALQFPILISMPNQQFKAYSSQVYFDGQSQFVREFPISFVRYGKPYAKKSLPLEIN